jgi:ABC-type phosphate transport system auxiliary subunit
MTYNFDPDRWLESRRAALEGQLEQGRLDREAYEAEMADLDRRYEEMLERLDGTYQIPHANGQDDR